MVALAPGVSRLRVLDVEHKSLGPRGAVALADALRAGAALAELRAARNPDLGCAHVVQTLAPASSVWL